MIGFETPEPRYPLHPLVSLVLALVVFTVGLLIDGLGVLAAYLAALSLLLAALGYWGAMRRAYVFVLPFGTVVGALAWLLGDTPAGAVETFGHVLLLALSSVMVSTINPTRLSRCLNQMGCPKWVALGLLVTARFIPVLRKEMERLREAMRVRGVEWGWRNPRQSWRALVVPLLARLVTISDTLSLSIETRGFRLETRGTVYRPLKLATQDGLVGLAILLTAAGALLVSW